MTAVASIIEGQGGSPEGVTADGAFSGNVYGTYIHGIFDSEQVAGRLIASLAKEKGIEMEGISAVDYAGYKEKQYDLLADTLRQHLDMEKIYEILEMGI